MVLEESGLADIITEIALHREIVVVTGASTGTGAATARELAKRGFHVLAGVRSGKDVDTLQVANVESVLLDITDDPERRPLRALVNNAGIGINAPIEVLPLAEWRRLFDVNLFGHVAMMQALLPMLIESRGTVVNISSVGGKVAMTTYGPYSASKFAFEAVSDSLRPEVEPLGVKVIVVEPDAVRTEMLGRVTVMGERIISGMTIEQHGRYARLMHSIIAQAEAAIPKGVQAEEVGRVIADAITCKRPRTRYTVGHEAAIVVRLATFLSDRLLDNLPARSLKAHLP